MERRAAADPGSAQFRVVKLRTGGEVVFSRSYAYRPNPVTRDLVDSLVAIKVAKRTSGLPAGPYEKLIREALYVPDHELPVKNVVAGRDGTTWLQRETLRADSAVWNVLDEAGQLVAVTAVTPGLTVLQAQRDMVWGVEHDELGVPYIVRYRVWRKQVVTSTPPVTT